MPAHSDAEHDPRSLRRVVERLQAAAARVDALAALLEDHEVSSLKIKFQDGLAKGMARVEKWTNAGHDALQKRLEEKGAYRASPGAETPRKRAKKKPVGRKKTTKKRG